ncbi:MAG: molybdopterin oxidoreductase [Planctomycetaceae bacterium]|nr:molybdopterin oxidoreductase [Planctomycetaceae bacterium]
MVSAATGSRECHSTPNSLLTWLLDQQQELTAVESFAVQYDGDAAPAQAKYYSRLLPASPPGPGQQYAFEVDLDRCSGCKACVTACHTLNGLDERETWRDVGLLIGGTSANPLVQHVTTACHHCLEPACLTACPVDAYVKDPITGIVKHLDDQCFGCQYCTLACPYDVPRYHPGKGIVRKCDMCSSRLAVGEAPACVQACPHEAISIRVVDTRQVVEDCEAGQFLPGAPDPRLTLPTTNFKTARSLPRNALPADFHQTSAQHSHRPLIVMLVLTQLSVGAFAAARVVSAFFGPATMTSVAGGHATVALVLGLLALAASLLHLGRPLYAFRAIIGLRHSWLSREILAFSIFAGLATVFAASLWLSSQATVESSAPIRWLENAVVISGLVAVFCSVMVYVATRRECWSFGNTAARFFLTAGTLGICTLWVTTAWSGSEGRLEPGRTMCGAIVACMTAKLLLEAAALRWLWSGSTSSWKRSAQLLVGPLADVTLARFACGLLGGVFLPMIAWHQADEATETLLRALVVVAAAVALLAGETLERYLFFAAAAAPRMPGTVRP